MFELYDERYKKDNSFYPADKMMLTIDEQLNKL